jgi:hypothetical protein
LKEARRFALQNAPGNVRAMVEAGVAEKVEERAARARLGIGRSVDDPGDPRQDDGPGAHGAWLYGCVKDCITQALVFQSPGGGAQDENLRVGRGVAKLANAVSVGGQNFAVEG